MALYFLSFLCLTNMQVALALLTKERFGWTEKEVSYLFALFGATGLVIQGGLIGRLVKKVGEVNLLVIAGLFSATGLGLISVAYSVPYLMLGAALFSCGFAMSTPTLSSLASRCARPEQQGVIMGMSQSSGGLARTVGPTWAGFLFQKVGAGAPFAGGAIYATLWVLVALTLRRLMRPTPQEDQGVVQEVPS
jgi:MFS family permease